MSGDDCITAIEKASISSGDIIVIRYSVPNTSENLFRALGDGLNQLTRRLGDGVQFLLLPDTMQVSILSQVEKAKLKELLG